MDEDREGGGNGETGLASGVTGRTSRFGARGGVNNLMTKQSIQCVVIYPFAGIKGSDRLFTSILDIAKEVCDTPILVYDERCPNAESAQKDIKKAEDRVGARTVRGRGVDTCQNWLDGWRIALEGFDAGRVVLLPGDLRNLKDEAKVLKNIRSFVKAASFPFIIGNFKSIDPYSAKELIDVYGVFPLVANWFPEAWGCIRATNIEKPRSEFLNLSAEYLRDILRYRPFAYEQTLSMLIRTWYQCKDAAHGRVIEAVEIWKQTVHSLPIGEVSDAPGGRNYAGAIDQIERTERMLRTLWRELEEWTPSAEAKLFMDDVKEYGEKDERSTAIRNAGRIAIWALLGASDM